MPRDADKTTPFEKSGRAKPATARVGPNMFGNFAAAKKRKMPKWAFPLLTAMLAFHVVLFVTMWVKTIWDIEALERPKNAVDLAIATPPPPPPPPPKGGVKPKDVVITPKKVKVRDIVQPVKIEKKEEVAPPVETGDPNGVEGGVEGGVVGGDLSGVVTAPPPPAAPPPPPPPQNVAPLALDQARIAGEKQIMPDDVTKIEFGRTGKDRMNGSYKLCITAEGSIASVGLLKSTGFPAYDQKIITTIRAEWRYRPYMLNGKPQAVCSVVTFIYSQH